MKYDWPDKLDILGCMWTLEQIEVGDKKVRPTDWGESDCGTLSIKVWVSGDKVWDWNTLIHEIRHAIEGTLTSDIGLAGKEEIDEARRIVSDQASTHGMAYVLVKNGFVK